MQGTSMNNGIMSNRHIVANGCPVFLVGAVNTGAVLHIHFITHFYKIHIPADHSIEPGTATVTHDYIANDGGVGGDEAIVTKLGVFVFDGENKGHIS